MTSGFNAGLDTFASRSLALILSATVPDRLRPGLVGSELLTLDVGDAMSADEDEAAVAGANFALKQIINSGTMAID